MSKLRDGKAKLKELQEDNDIILNIGKEGKEGDANFKKFQKDLDLKSKVKRDIVLNEIEVKKRERGYHRFLSELLTERLRTVFFPLGWSHIEAPSDRGVVMELKSPDSRTFRSAFASSKDPMYDLNAIDNFSLRAENTIERITESKLIV